MDKLHNIQFESLWMLIGIPLIPLLYFVIQKYFKRNDASLAYSSIQPFQQLTQGPRIRLRFLLNVFRFLAVSSLLIAIARPQLLNKLNTVNGLGIDIVLAMDISGSMLADDFKPNRLEAAKEVAKEFIMKRANDNMGLVIFSGESFTQCPLTNDLNILLNQVDNIRSGLLQDGTAIGMGLATGVERLRESKAKSKVIILITDGENNMGTIDPETALEIAKTYGAKVYTIGVGTFGKANMPSAIDMFGNIIYEEKEVKIDEPLLTKIATETGGKYYRATDETSLAKIYQEIDSLEKSKIDIKQFQSKTELFLPFIYAAFILLAIELLLRYTYFRTYP